MPYAFPVLPLLIGTALVGLSLSLRAGAVLDSRPVRFVARISFGIYIWHFLVMWLAPHVWEPAFRTWEADGWSNWLLTSSGVIMATLIIATLSFYLIEQPAVRWARRLEHRAVPARPALAQPP